MSTLKLIAETVLFLCALAIIAVIEAWDKLRGR